MTVRTRQSATATYSALKRRHIVLQAPYRRLDPRMRCKPRRNLARKRKDLPDTPW